VKTSFIWLIIFYQLVECSKAVLLHYADTKAERRYSSYSLLTSALHGGEWLASRPGYALPPRERTPDTHWTGGWVGLRAGLDTEDIGKILSLCQGSNPTHPVCSQDTILTATPAPILSTRKIKKKLQRKSTKLGNFIRLLRIQGNTGTEKRQERLKLGYKNTLLAYF
jgi:hypothetical protein